MTDRSDRAGGDGLPLDVRIQEERYAMFRLLRSDAPHEQLREQWSKLETLLDTPAAPPSGNAGEMAAEKAARYLDDLEAGLLPDRDGFWRTCSGCYEAEDGYPNGHYPHSRIFNCTLGGGCSECGGLGAVWDTTDYSEIGEEVTSTFAPADRGGEA